MDTFQETSHLPRQVTAAQAQQTFDSVEPVDALLLQADFKQQGGAGVLSACREEDPTERHKVSQLPSSATRLCLKHQMAQQERCFISASLPLCSPCSLSSRVVFQLREMKARGQKPTGNVMTRCADAPCHIKRTHHTLSHIFSRTYTPT